jgi:hypothetical protein
MIVGQTTHGERRRAVDEIPADEAHPARRDGEPLATVHRHDSGRHAARADATGVGKRPRQLNDAARYGRTGCDVTAAATPGCI